MPHDTRIAEFLLSIGAVRLSVHDPFTWTSGIKSPIYCDNRMIYSHPEARTVAVDALVEKIKGLSHKPDFIAGTATAAIGWAALVADRMDLPFVYVRTKPKEHGAKKRIEGDLPEGKTVVVVEDLISTGGSSISTADALREEGKATVYDVVAIFTYGMNKATEASDQAGIALHPLTNIATLLQVALDQDRIIDEEKELIEDFIKSPKDWKLGN